MRPIKLLHIIIMCMYKRRIYLTRKTTSKGHVINIVRIPTKHTKLKLHCINAVHKAMQARKHAQYALNSLHRCL